MRHYHEKIFVPQLPQTIFAYIDDHRRFSAHMNQSSWMMAGSKMHTQLDQLNGQAIGSHIKMTGRILGINIFLDEVVITREPPYRKIWKTVGNIKLIIIGHYQMGFELKPTDQGSTLKVFIDYELPTSFMGRLLGLLLSGIYARWCVNQMILEVQQQYSKSRERG